ncbi:tetratricopeptide repeat protein [Asticcacaulis sp. AC460]|uniref:tetratricopeptide repeat protein n=1 Tax=Asticcacaulis sp. AC460 TaxID=1282360 RepID=UPI0012DC0368|nr:tetratricopeptide repeat protein [Asticcacaulis sp. AC460]
MKVNHRVREIGTSPLIAFCIVCSAIAPLSQTAAAATTSTLSIDKMVAECDEKAGAFYDKDRPTKNGYVEFVAINPVEAISSCQKAFDLRGNDRHVAFNLGRAYVSGKNYAMGNVFLERAIDQGSTAAMVALSTIYADGIGTDIDTRKSFELLSRASAAGNDTATATLGADYLWGRNGLTRDVAKALPLLKTAADLGNAQAMYYLGEHSWAGLGPKGDFSSARYWFEKGAAAGEPNAMVNLGRLYRFGVGGLKKDYVTARSWYDKANKLGARSAPTQIGLLYEEGLGTPQNYGLARQWYEKGIITGDQESFALLASLYERGLGVTKDNEKAAALYSQAAAKGSSFAMQQLGQMYIKGKGVAKDVVRGEKLIADAKSKYIASCNCGRDQAY